MPLDIAPAVTRSGVTDSAPVSASPQANSGTGFAGTTGAGRSPQDGGQDPNQAEIDKLPQADPNFDPKSSPIVSAVAGADVPGVVFTPDDLKNPQVAPLAANARSLLNVGLGVYGMKDGRKALFNPQVVTPEEVQKLDAAGKLDQILVPFSKVGKSGAGAGSATTPDKNSEQPSATAGAGQGPAQVGPAEPMGPTMPAGAASKLATARVNSMKSSGSPSPSAPAAGGILGRMLKPVV